MNNGFSTSVALEYLGVELDEQTDQIISILQSKDSISENDLAEQLNLKINQTRKSLYKLHELGFVEYSKQKDAEKKWWYIYFWSFNKAKLKDIYKRRKLKELKDKQEQLKAEQRYSFECTKDNIKFEYESALSSGFSCSACSRPLKEVKNSKLMSQLEKDISRLKKETSNN